MNRKLTRRMALTAAFATGAALTGIGSREASAQRGTLVIKGSDTLVNLSQAWAEAYMKKNPGARISVTGGGTGVGIAAFLNGQADIANASRPMSGSEVERSKARGVVPVGTACALDGLAIAVHASNPIKDISIDELSKIFAGGVGDWSQLGEGKSGKMTVLSRESSSGTYVYFRDNVLKGKPYRSDALLMPSTKAIALEIARNPGAIGYGGEAYFKGKSGIKVIPVSAKKGAAAIYPSDENVKSRKYPIARALYMYTPGKPSGLASSFIKWCLSEEGQVVVGDVGYTRIK